MSAAAEAVAVVPEDAGLPHLRELLDPARMEVVLARQLAAGRSLRGVKVLYLRYKPATRLIVRYGVELDDGAYDAHVLYEPGIQVRRLLRDPAVVALARLVEGRTPARGPIWHERGLGALVQWLPLDVTMPALAQPPAELRRTLRERGVDVAPDGPPPRLLAFKARRRAVLELDDHVVKIYAGEPEFEAAQRGLEGSRLIRALRTPAPEAVLPEFRLTCQSRLEGCPPSGADEPEAVAGAALSILHGAAIDGLAWFKPEDQLAAAAASARGVTAVLPALGPRVSALVERLGALLPRDLDLLPAHGDFHARQLVESGGILALIDFDELCAAPPALDFSSYAAHVVTGAPGELELASAALDRLAAGYGRRPSALAWYVATSILRRAPFPFRFMDDGWPARIEQMVADAEEALAL